VLVVGLANTVFGLFYYMRILKTIFIAPLPEGARPVDLATGSHGGRYVLVVALPVLLLGIFVDPISHAARGVATWLIRG
jgi:NADH:ubiquinone oxidoreductase subunit 2 (subunit N)